MNNPNLDLIFARLGGSAGRRAIAALGILALLAGTPVSAFAQETDALRSLGAFTVWEMVKAAGWVMLPLLACSIVVMTLVLFYIMTMRDGAIVTNDLLRRLRVLFEKEDLDAVASYVSERPQAVARVLDQTCKFLERHPDADPAALQSVAEAEGNRLASTLNQRTVYLMDAGVLAPMLGLFGTVVGILRSFGSIGLEEAALRTTRLAGGISEALIATAAGLIIGITAMAFYSYFRGRALRLISLLEGHSTVLLNELILLRKRRMAHSGGGSHPDRGDRLPEIPRDAPTPGRQATGEELFGRRGRFKS